VLKPGDLVRVRKTAISNWSTKWFVDFAESKTPMLVVKVLYPKLHMKSHMELLRPDGSTCFLCGQDLTKRLW